MSKARIMIHIKSFSEKRPQCLEKVISGRSYEILSQSRDLFTLSELETQLKAHLFVLWYLASKFSILIYLFCPCIFLLLYFVSLYALLSS